MDSVTQIALGAAIGEAVLGRKVGRRATLWGAVLGTLPDLDILIPYGDAVADFTYHRTFSHSLLVLALVSPLFGWLISRIHPSTAQHWRGWMVLAASVLLTHPLLDSFTVYGTQLFWPIDMTPVLFSSVFIIDPLYTLPLLVGVFAIIFMRKNPHTAYRINLAGLLLSSLYLSWGLVAKYQVEEIAANSLAAQEISYTQLITIPAPFNTILWRVVAMSENGYYEGFYSLLDPTNGLKVTRYPSANHLLSGIKDYWPVTRLIWFTRGYYNVERREKDIVMADLRMGLEPNYVFRFKVGELGNPHAHPAPVEQIRNQWQPGQLRYTWERIWSPTARRNYVTGTNSAGDS